ncbi:tetratricopeptide repeat protein [Chiayiivirga flava]|uniref:Tetratricopeptide (TPR) repeat protein n=1 Tax=Chiayiivirga flava TaxID=659595 RepID=A0A7W8D9K6_9GAMM|nr:tetratricopeptide repeat protein [Chiayiivirga flava]MBB5209101.1 tetratricopeptide (TPR) repeat protein [Chiayiivirga flava]
MMVRTCLVYLLLALAASHAAAQAASRDDADLLPLLQGEFALQEGASLDAAKSYVEAARASKDPALAERALQVALLADDIDAAKAALRRWRQLAPDAPGLLPAQARLALKQGDRRDALKHLGELLQRPDGWRAAIPALAANARLPITVDVLGELVRGDRLPDQLEAWFAFGGLALRLEQAELGAELARRAIERFPNEPRAWLWQAENAQRRGDADAARTAVAKALTLGPMDPPTRLAAAAQLDALGDPAGAAAALAQGEQDDATLAGRAAYLSRAEDGGAIQALYDDIAARTDAPSPARLYLLGQLAELLKLPERALEWYGRVPGDVQRDQAQLRIAVLLDQKGLHEDAVARLNELQASDSEYGDVVRDAYLLEAELALQRNQPADALDAYGRGLGIFEGDPDLLYARALAYEKLDRIDDAEYDLRQLIEEDPDNADFLNALGYTLADRTDRHEEALALIQRALELQPDAPAIIDSMGWVLHRLGRNEEALPHLRRAFELQRDAEVAAHLGEVLWALGQKDEARSIWRLGQEIDPDNRALKQSLGKLQS